ncbi:MAG: ATP-dependent RecD-like DNA helicase [Thermoanaerobaculales bacterium]|nr:ATP-dependent RecD-like DNA helicase [Thermoanaerobaculales bacterium]
MERQEVSDQERVSLEAVVDRITYSNEESGWCVVRMKSANRVSFTATGPLFGIQVGDRLRLSGKWVQHARFGEQLEVSNFLEILPSTLEGIRRFLASGRVKGVGPKNAERLVTAFGMETLDIVEHEPEKMTQIQGIGKKTAAKISQSWAKNRGIQRIMVFLTGHGVAPGIAVRLHRRYGEGALAVVRDNPYRLAEEVYGVGFLTADRIARSLGLPPDSPERLAAGLLFALVKASLEGHVFLPEDVVFERARGLLGDEEADLSGPLEGVRRTRQVVVHGRGEESAAVFLSRLDRAEAEVAAGFSRLLKEGGQRKRDFDADREVTLFQRKSKLDFAEEQRMALVTALEQPVTIITGGPGTGKTTLVQGIVKILARKEQRVLLAAPTGRAAKRLEEATGHGARTLHRLLEYNPVERIWGRNADHPLDADCVVVDEVSMLDTELAARLVGAVPPGCRLVLVGDSDQLPSVGPGDVLADLINSRTCSVIRLRRIFRQGEGSLIAENAHRINRGEMPVYGKADSLSDFYFAIRQDPTEAADTAVELAAERIPRRFGFHPIEDIQLLAPMHRGELGVQRLNERLQEKLVPAGGPELKVGARAFRLGDKVMQLRNNYELDVYNGDIGRVLAIDCEEQKIRIDFSGRTVDLRSEDLEDLTTAYACTIHKSQGSEYPAVVVLLHDQHHIMLQRNLLYTAVTRGKKLVVLVGSRRALSRAVRTASVRHRNTLLCDRLQRAVGEKRL